MTMYESDIYAPMTSDIQLDQARVNHEIAAMKKKFQKILDEVQYYKYNYYFNRAKDEIIDSFSLIFNGLLEHDRVLQSELHNLWYEIDQLKTRVTNLEVRMDSAELRLTALENYNVTNP